MWNIAVPPNFHDIFETNEIQTYEHESKKTSGGNN